MAPRTAATVVQDFHKGKKVEMGDENEREDRMSGL
jgi:hypothetical protein